MLALGFTHLLTEQGLGKRLRTAGRELAAAVLLVVELILSEQLVAALLKASFAPVLRPEGHAREGLLSSEPRTVDLLQVLPAAGGQRRGKTAEAPLRGRLCRRHQPQAEALLAAAAALRLLLQSADALEPLLVVVVAVNPLQPQTFGMALALLLANLILLARPDVRVIIKDGGLYVALHQPLYNSRRAGGAAGVEKNLRVHGLSTHAPWRH